MFPTVVNLIERIKDEEEDIVPERQTWASIAATDCQHCLLKDYSLKGILETSLTTCHKTFKAILNRLQQIMQDRLALILNDPLYQVISQVLGTRSYQHVEFEDILVMLQVMDHFSSVLNNSFDLRKVKNEFKMIYKHVNHFKSNAKPAKCWPAILNLRLELGVNNALTVAQIWLVKSKWVFTFLLKNFSKEWSSMKSDSMENILCLCDDKDFSKCDIVMLLNYFWRNIQMEHFDREVVT